MKAITQQNTKLTKVLADSSTLEPYQIFEVAKGSEYELRAIADCDLHCNSGGWFGQVELYRQRGESRAFLSFKCDRAAQSSAEIGKAIKKVGEKC